MGDLGRDVSRETFQRLTQLSELVTKWSGAINLVARSTLDDIWERHIQDSIQVFRLAPPCQAWADLGTGGGFPGLVVAILAADEHPEMNVTLIESDQRKCVFLRTVLRETGVAAKVITKRIEEAPRQNADVVSARALADLDKLLAYCERHLARNGLAILPKGAQWKSEVEAARKRWCFEHEVIESITGTGAAVLKIRGIERV